MPMKAIRSNLLFVSATMLLLIIGLLGVFHPLSSYFNPTAQNNSAENSSGFPLSAGENQAKVVVFGGFAKYAKYGTNWVKIAEGTKLTKETTLKTTVSN